MKTNEENATMRRCPHCGQYAVPSDGTLLKGKKYVVYQCGFCGHAWPEEVELNTQLEVEALWRSILTATSKIMLGAQCAGSYAYKEAGQATTDLETFDTIIHDIQYNTNNLLYLFRKLQAAKWEEEHKEGEEDEEELWLCRRD